MPSLGDIHANKQRLYESSSLRDDLNDAEATTLLEWGETQIERLAKKYPDEFEEKARFLRQLLKHINRFVGQREFNEMDGQREYMSKVSMYLQPLGWDDVTEDKLFAALPADKVDMAANLKAILGELSTKSQKAEPSEPDTPQPILAYAMFPDIFAEPTDEPSTEANSASAKNRLIANYREHKAEQSQLEKTNFNSITQIDNISETEAQYGEEEK